MVSFFRVVRFYPDLVTGECVNVGVIAVDERNVVIHALSDPSRVASLTGDGICENAQRYLSQFHSFSPERIKTHESHYMSCYRLADVCASTHTVYVLAQDMADLMLGEGKWLPLENPA